MKKEVKGNGDKNAMSEEVRRQDKGKERRIKDNVIHVYMDSDHTYTFRLYI